MVIADRRFSRIPSFRLNSILERKGLALALAATTACATVPRPEGPAPVEPGQRVRVTLASRAAPGPLQGTVVSVAPDTLIVAREEGGERLLSRNQVDAIEISVAREQDAFKAAGYGILTGAPLLVPLAIFMIVSPYGIDPTWFVLPVAGLATAGAIMGGGSQDVWVDAVWPVSAETSSADTPAADSLAGEDP